MDVGQYFLQKTGHQLATLLMLVAVVVLPGCFTLREPAQPTASTGWTSPTEPDVLLENFRQAVRELNLVNYERCLKPMGTFRFVADPTTSGQNVGIFQRWTLQEELEYIKNLRNKSTNTAANNLTLQGGRRNFLNADSLEITSNYSLSIFHTDTSYNRFQFEGTLIMTLVRGRNNEWAIRNWQDNRSGSLPCWTDLKQVFVIP